jgi:hypothetical protein
MLLDSKQVPPPFRQTDMLRDTGKNNFTFRLPKKEKEMKKEPLGDPVLIVGGGIAGPALGIALRRAGIESVVYDGSPGPRDDAGAFLNLAPNGLNVLRGMDVGYLTDDLGFRNDRIVFHNDMGRVLADVSVGAVTLLRGALSRALREAAVSVGVRFEFGKFLESVEEHEENVIGRFADGTTATGSALVGSDGIHSSTRYRFFPEAPKPTYTGIIDLGGVVRTDIPPTGTTMHLIFGHRGFFGYAVRPSGDTYWFSNFVQPGEPAPGGPHVGQGASLSLLRMHSYSPSVCATYPILWPHLACSRDCEGIELSAWSSNPGAPVSVRLPPGGSARKMRDLILVFLRKGAKAAECMYEYKLDWEERISPNQG